MSRKIRSALLYTAVLFNFNTWAMPQQDLVPLSINYEFHYEFPANAKRTISNYAPWTISAKCKFTTENNSTNEVEVILLNYGHTCLVNNLVLKKCNDASCNDRVALPIHTGDELNFSVDSGAQLELFNHGSSIITIDCSTK